MGPPLYTLSVVDRNVVMWRIPVLTELTRLLLQAREKRKG